MSTNAALNGKTVIAIAAGSGTRLRSPRGQGYAWAATAMASSARTGSATTTARRNRSITRQQWIPGEDDRRDRGRLGSQHRARVRRHPLHLGGERSRPDRNGGTSNRNDPGLVTTSGVLNGKFITAIAGGDSHTTAPSSEGRVYDWGFNDYGQLGNNTKGTDTPLPFAVDTTGALAGKPWRRSVPLERRLQPGDRLRDDRPRILDVAAPTAKFHRRATCWSSPSRSPTPSTSSRPTARPSWR